MKMNRRDFLILTTGVATGCQSMDENNIPVAGRETTINAGPVGDYAANGVYSRFRDQGFFIIRHGEKLFAMSAYCTHRRCKLTAEADRTFYCKCHGSTFNSDGKVTRGPARIDLPQPATTTNDLGQLLVKISNGV